jgi:hypothetical protein
VRLCGCAAVRLCGASKNREENKIRKCIHIFRFTYKNKYKSTIFFTIFYYIFSSRVKQRYLLPPHCGLKTSAKQASKRPDNKKTTKTPNNHTNHTHAWVLFLLTKL